MFSANFKLHWKSVLLVSWPLIIANSFWNLQLTIDRIFLGQYSTDALGAAMAVMGVFWTPMALIQQVPAYISTFVAQYFGAKENSNIGPAVWQATFIGVLGGLLCLLMIPFSKELFEFMGHTPNMQKLEAEYFSALCWSALPTALLAVAGGFFTGLGRSQVVMWLNGIGLLANAILDPIMIFGMFGFPELGIAGAGYATAAANWISAIVGFGLLLNQENEVLFKIRSSIKFQKDLCLRFLKYGLPAGLQFSLEGLAFTVFLLFLGRMENGDAALSASGIGVTILMLAILPAFGLGQGAAVLVGQNLGEKKPDLAEKKTWVAFTLAEIYIVTMALSFVLFPQFYLSWFDNGKGPELWAEISAIVPWILKIIAIFVCFDAMNLVFSSALRGAGDTRFVTAVALIVPWPLMVLPTYFLHTLTGGVYWSWLAAGLFACVQALIFLFRFKGGKWKTLSVIHDGASINK